jgi:hypothetical protein
MGLGIYLCGTMTNFEAAEEGEEKLWAIFFTSITQKHNMALD